MKLKGKTFAILLGSTALIFGVVYAWSRLVLLGGFVEVENKEVQRDLEQVVDTLKDQISAIGTRTSDWAFWDDTYQFVADVNQEYIDKNIGYEQFAALSSIINFILLFNEAGEHVYSKGYDLQTEKEIPVPPSLLRQLTKDSPFLKHLDEKSKMEGLLLLDDAPVMVASRPILTSELNGPIRGTLVFAGFLNDFQIDVIAKTLRTSLMINRLEDSDLPEDMQQAKAMLSADNNMVVSVLAPKTVAGYTILRDVNNTPILMLRLDKPRAVHSVGVRTLQYFGIGILATGLIQAFVMQFILGKTVLNRLSRLTASLHAIELTTDLSQRVPVTGNDELAEVSASVNKTLEALERAETAVHMSEARMRAVLEHAVDGIVTTDDEGRIQSFNKAAERIFGYSAEEVVGRDVSLLMPEPYKSQHPDYLKDYLATNQAKIIGKGREILGQRKEGIVFPAYIALSEIRVGEQRLFTGIIRDITEHKRHEAFLTQAAMYDPLTGLLNRRFFEEQLDVALNAAKRYRHALCLCMGDVDKFKEINDRYGHTVGDIVLEKLGDLIRAQVRKEDVAGRFGGDEFVICFSHTSSIEAVACIERVRQTLASHVFCQDTDHPFIVTGSFGFADLTTHDMDKTALIQAADRSLYRAKEQGRNRTVLDVE
ncbi:MAG TPA: diguanylate cyclase [Candidatus Hydrogenedentes bacterium]|nr:diguanylate cyclase [Candidatus Hydrogenedentota bacterium]